MLRRVPPLLVTLSLALAACGGAAATGPSSPQPIRDEKEPGESHDYVSAVPESGSASVEELSGESSTEIEVDGDSAAAGADDKATDGAAGDGDPADGGEPDEPGEPTEIEIEIEP